MTSFPFSNQRLGKYIETVSTVDDLRNISLRNVRAGDAVLVIGNQIVGDQNGAVYAWFPKEVGADDQLGRIKPYGATNGRWLLAVGRGSIGPRGVQGIQGVQGIPGTLDAGAYTYPADTAVPRVPSGKLADVISIKDFGATANGVSDDAPAIQAALETLIPAGGAPPFGGTGAELLFPRGKYALGTSLKLFHYSILKGNGKEGTVLLGNPSKPVLENRDPNALVFAHMEGFSTLGGTHGLFVGGYTDNITVRDISFLNPTVAGIEVTGFLQTATFDNIRIGGAPYGIKSNTTIANNVVMIRPDITGCETAFYLRGSEDVTVIGARVEGGGHPTKPIIDVVATTSLTFQGGYFEGGSPYLLKGIASNVCFDGTHFTFHQANVPYLWQIDSNSRLTFRNCHSTIAMTVPQGSVVENCQNIFAATSYQPASMVDSTGINKSTNTTAKFSRTSDGMIRVRAFVTINAPINGFLKFPLPPAWPMTENTIFRAFNITTNEQLNSVANLSDQSVYTFSPAGTGFGSGNQQILIEGSYPIAG